MFVDNTYLYAYFAVDNNKSEKISKMEKTRDPEIDKIRRQLIPVLTDEEERGVELSKLKKYSRRFQC